MLLRFPLLVLLTLSAVTLLAVPSLASVAAQRADGEFRGWSLSYVAPHPTNTSVVFVVDGLNVRALDSRNSRELFSVSFTSPYSTFLQLESLTVDAKNNVVYVLTNDWATDVFSLVTLSSKLQPITDVELNDLLVPAFTTSDHFVGSPMVDSDGIIYIVRRLYNSTTLVHVLQNNVQIDVWQTPFSTPSDINFLVAMGSGNLLNFQTLSQFSTTPQALFVTSTAGLLVATLRLSNVTIPIFGNYFPALAVSRNSGNIAICFGANISLFTSSGVHVSSFNYMSNLYEYGGFRRLAFDASDRLLAVAEYDEDGVQIISTANGDLLGTLASPVPSLAFSTGLVYERQTKSLLLVKPQASDEPVLRLDADNGWLVQEYPLVGRYDNCYSLTSILAASSGNIYNLLVCTMGRAGGVPVLQATTSAGKLIREAAAFGLTYRQVLSQLVVDENRELFFMLVRPASVQLNVFQVLAFGFNGTYVYNFTDSRIGNIGTGARLLRVDDLTIAVVDSSNFRIAQLSLDSRSLSNNITIPRDINLLAAVYAAGSWYRAERTFNNITRYYTISINQYTNGSLIQQFFVETTRTNQRLTQQLAVDSEASRLYLLANDGDRYSTIWYIAYWNLRRTHEQQQQGKQQTGPEQNGVRRVQQSGMQVLAGESRSGGKWRRQARSINERAVDQSD